MFLKMGTPGKFSLVRGSSSSSRAVVGDTGGHSCGDWPLPVRAALSHLVHTHVGQKGPPRPHHLTVEPTRSPGLCTPTPSTQRPLSIPPPGSPHDPPSTALCSLNHPEAPEAGSLSLSAPLPNRALFFLNINTGHLNSTGNVPTYSSFQRQPQIKIKITKGRGPF